MLSNWFLLHNVKIVNGNKRYYYYLSLNYVRIWSNFGRTRLFRCKQCRVIINLKKVKGENLKCSSNKGVDITTDRFNKIMKYL